MNRLLASTVLILCAASAVAPAQSTFGSIVGVVHDASDASIRNAVVKLTNIDRNVTQETLTGGDGAYEFLNLVPGRYKLEASSPGFRAFSYDEVSVLARQTVRADAKLEVGATEQSVSVVAETGVIASETPTVASTLATEKLTTLPGNFRASGSTSPYRLIGTLPGVQGDDGNSFSIQGALPAQSQSTIDGISAQHVRNNSPLVEIFPSTETIAEIKVQGIGNNAEYGAVGDVTTVSKSGTNQFHGALFWYHQNRALDATRFGATTKPQKVSNDFGFALGGPVSIPRLYNGQDKTFFFFAYEDARYPRGQTIQNTVPTDALRNGDFSAEGVTIKDPRTGLAFANNRIPVDRISPVAAKFLSLYPLPNAGPGGKVTNANYIANSAANLDSRQYDIKVDHYITSKQLAFVRFSNKDATQLSPNDLLLPSIENTRSNRSLVASHNYTITPSWLNEFRFGFTKEGPSSNFPFDGRAFTNSLGFKNIGPDFPFNGVPNLDIDNFTGLDIGRAENADIYRTFQLNNNTTWNRGRHTVKFGVDIRMLRSKTALGFIGADNYGNSSFGGAFSGNAFADFLLGLPSETSFGGVQQDNDGRVTHYHAFVQDSFRVNRKLTLELGLRYELHPGFKDESFNIGNFDRSVPLTGRVVYPSDPKAKDLLAPGLLLSVNACGLTGQPGLPGVPCTPFVTAQQAGIPETLRLTYKDRFFPRFGFAYRPFADSNTVVRGNFGIYNMAILGGVFYSLTGTAQTDVRTFNNIGPDGKPLFAWPDTRTASTGVSADAYGYSYFGTANQIDFKNPYAMQFSLSVDRNIGGNVGLRASYIGLKSVHLPYAPNLNQSTYSTQYFALQPLTNRPFPYWGRVESRDTGALAFYNALQMEVSRRFSGGLAFNGAYTFAKNLTDNGGPSPSGFSGETGGGRILDSLNRHGGWGNDYATRRNRFIGTVVYDMPFGKGRPMMANANPVAQAVLGGWQLSSIILLQGGPALTPRFSSGVGDPSGTGSGFYRDQRPDRIGDGAASTQNSGQWLDRAAFLCPGRAPGADQFNCGVGLNPASDPAPIGRFGNSGIGILRGPGTVNLSLGLGKSFNFTERVRLRMEGSFTNLPNHVNLADPELRINNGAFGRITSARDSESGGSRTGQVGMRLEF